MTEHAEGAVTARAGVNFALVKYWGKRDRALNLPAAGSISITLDALWSETSVRLRPDAAEDVLELDRVGGAPAEARVRALLDRIRQRAGRSERLEVRSHNNFPTGAGLASSASGFAALVTAACAALDFRTEAAERSELARLGSGSAARSIFGGYVEMHPGQRDDGADAIAQPLAEAAHWPLAVVIALTDPAPKSVGSSEGMEHTRQSSPFYSAWIEGQPAQLAAARRAIAERDFEQLAAISEASCLAMHAVAFAARPGLVYFNGATIDCLHRIRLLRQQGLGVFFTVDAGAQVKAICEPAHRDAVAAALAELPGVRDVWLAGLGPGARLLGAGAAGSSGARPA